MNAIFTATTARDVMSKDVVTVHPQENVHEALQLLAANGLSMLPVVDGRGTCVGVLSQVDLVRLTSTVDDEDHDPAREPGSVVNGPAQLSEITNERIDDIMSEALVFVRPDTTVAAVAELMISNAIHHILVLDEESRLQGVISTIDVLKVLTGT